MLPLKNRLKKKRDFETIFKKGQGFREGFLALKFIDNNSGQTRFGFIVSQKISKRAIVRNKVKRRFRQSVRKRLGEIKKGIDIVFIAIPGIEKKDFKEIEEVVEKLLKRAKVLNP
jgi:ribonuclease P protein component